MNPLTQLLRQINPCWIREDVILSQGFAPTGSDAGKLSVDDGDQIEPRQAHEHFTETIGLKSAGTWAVLVEEAGSSGLTPCADALPIRPNIAPKIPDPLPAWPSHSVIDFNPLTASEQRVKAKILASHAQKRGAVYRPKV